MREGPQKWWGKQVIDENIGTLGDGVYKCLYTGISRHRHYSDKRPQIRCTQHIITFFQVV